MNYLWRLLFISTITCSLLLLPVAAQKRNTPGKTQAPASSEKNADSGKEARPNENPKAGQNSATKEERKTVNLFIDRVTVSTPTGKANGVINWRVESPGAQNIQVKSAELNIIITYDNNSTSQTNQTLDPSTRSGSFFGSSLTTITPISFNATLTVRCVVDGQTVIKSLKQSGQVTQPSSPSGDKK